MSDFLISIGGDTSGLTSAMENAKREIIGVLNEIRARASEPIGSAFGNLYQAAGGAGPELESLAARTAGTASSFLGAGAQSSDVVRFVKDLQRFFTEAEQALGVTGGDLRSALKKTRSRAEEGAGTLTDRYDKIYNRDLVDKSARAAATRQNQIEQKRFQASEEGLQYEREVARANAQILLNKQKAAREVIEDKLSGRFTNQEGRPVEPVTEDAQSAYLREKYQRSVDVAKEGLYTPQDLAGHAIQNYLGKRNQTQEALYTEQALANDKQLTEQTGLLASLRRRRATAEEQATLNNITYEDILKEATLKVTQSRIKLAEELLVETQVTQEDIQSRGQLAASRKSHLAQEQAVQEQLLSADRAYVQATVEASVLRRVTNERVKEGELAAVGPSDFARQARIADQQALNRARVSLSRAGENLGYDQRPESVIGRGAAADAARKQEIEAARLAELTDQESALGQRYINAKAEATISQERLTNAIKVATNAQVSEADLARRSEVTYSGKVQTLAEQVQTLRRSLGLEEAQALLNKDAVELEAQRNVLQKQYNAKVIVGQRELAQKEGLAGPDATLFQRFQARFRTRTTGANGGVPTDPTELPTLGQFLTGKALTTVGFAATGFAFYGAIQGVHTLINDAKELEKTFDLVKAQFTAVDQAGEFPHFKQGIIDIATSTGEAVQDVAQIALQLKGAFGNDNNQALIQTEALVKSARVTGISVHEAIDNYTAITRTYGVTVEQVSDKALGLQDRFGVMAKETVGFLGQIAPAAKEAGFSLDELGAIAATAQKYSGRSGSAIAESLGRIFPAIQQNILKLKDVIKLDPKDVASGNLGNIFFSVIKQYDSLTQDNKDLVISLLGSRREAQTLSAVFGHTGEILGELNKKTNDAGRTNKSYAEIQKSLSQTLAELRQKFTEFALKVYESGLGDFLKDLVKVFELLAGVIGRLGSLPGVKQLVELLLLMKTVSLIKGFGPFQGFGNAVGGFAGRLGGRAAAAGELSAIANGTGGPILAREGQAANLIRGTAISTEGKLGSLRASLAGAEGGISGLTGGLVGMVGALAPAIALLLTMKAVGDYLSLRQHEGKQDESYGDSLKGASRDELRRALAPGGQASHTDFQESVRARLTGSQTNREQVASELRKRDSESLAYEIRDLQTQKYQKLINDLFDDTKDERLEKFGIDAGTINKLAQQARDHPGNQDYYKALKDFVLKLRKKLPKDIADKILADAQIHVDDRGNVLTDEDLDKKKLDAQQKQISDIQDSVKNAQDQYTSGLISFDDYAKSLRSNIDFLNKVKQEGGGKLSDENAKSLADSQKQLAQLYKTQYDAQVSIRESLGDLNPDQKVALLTQELQSPEIQGNRETMIQVAQELTQATKAFFDNSVKTSGSLEEALGIQKNGIKVPAELKNALEAQLKALGIENPQIPDYIKEDPQVVKQREDDLRKQINDARNQKQTADAHGDPIKQAQAQRDKALQDLDRALHDNLGDSQSRQAAILQAKAALEQADDAIADALKAKADALDQLAEAQLRADPVQVARIKLGAAQRHLREAKNDQEVVQAQIEIVQAQQELADNISAVLSAQSNLAAAVAEAAGNSADAVRIRLADLQRRLVELGAQGGAGSAAYINLQTEIVQQQHQLDTTLRNDQKDYYEFLYATKQITAQQLITYLEQLASGINQNTSEWRSLQQEIFNLKHQMSGNLAFNVPTAFDLPTLYEVRRLNASVQAGVGYTDNRQQVVNVFVANGMSPAQVTQAVQGALATGAGRYGVA